MNIFTDIIYHATRLAVVFMQLLVVWIVIALVIPGINWYEHVYWLGEILVGVPTIFIFNFFTEYHESLSSEDWSDHNPIQDAVYIMCWLGAIGLSLAAPVILWFTQLFLVVHALTNWNTLFDVKTSPDGDNMVNLLSGRTTIQKTFDADVTANAVASKFK